MTLARLIFATAFGFFGAAYGAPDWQTVPAKTMTLFYPGQSSLEWALTKADHRGADKLRSGKSCAACHSGEEKPIGDTIASGRKLEPAPIPGKPGSIAARVQIARDAERLYVHLEFSDAGQPDAKMDGASARVSMMLDGGGGPEFAYAGCWALCHDESEGMGKANGSHRTMYLGGTAKNGGAIEYWEATLNNGAAPAAANGVVSDQRQQTKPVAVAAEATYRNGMWSVTLSRRLNAGIVALVPGKRYTIAFAVDAGHTAGRFHYVSFERSLVLGQGAADFVVK